MAKFRTHVNLSIRVIFTMIVALVAAVCFLQCISFLYYSHFKYHSQKADYYVHISNLNENKDIFYNSDNISEGNDVILQNTTDQMTTNSVTTIQSDGTATKWDQKAIDYEYAQKTKPDVWKYPFQYALGSCDNVSEVDMVIMVTSRPSAFSRRHTIRKTWAGRFLQTPGVRVLFFIGILSSWQQMTTHELWKDLETEANTNCDLVLADFQDTYHNLSLKTFLAFRYALERYPSAQIFLKADDDDVIFSDNILKYLNEFDKSSSAFIGYVFHTSPIRRESPYYMPVTVYPEEKYPPFCSGHGYIGTRTALACVVKYTEEKLDYYIHLEDVLFTGILSELCNISRIDPGGWHPSDNRVSEWGHAYSIHYLGSDQAIVRQWSRYLKSLDKPSGS